MPTDPKPISPALWQESFELAFGHTPEERQKAVARALQDRDDKLAEAEKHIRTLLELATKQLYFDCQSDSDKRKAAQQWLDSLEGG